jgi:FtsH-binding integral membrane protein
MLYKGQPMNIPPNPGPVVAAPATSARAYTGPVKGIIYCLWAYLVTVMMAAVAPRYLAAGGTREFVLFLPLLTTLLVICITYWVYRASDEYIRHRILKCTALTGIILAFSSLGYFCLERLGYPQLSMIVINLYGWAVFTILILWVLYRAR